MNAVIRALNPSEIECRIKTCNKEKGVSLLLYKTARTDASILDETFGNMNWQDSYQEIDGKLFCTISIWDEEKKQWISKQDCGTESYTEKEKGQSSDAFKRAGFKWGIGRELYSAPKLIWVSSSDIKDWSNSGQPYDNFKVKYIKIESNKIVQLIIYNAKTKKDVYTYGV